MDKIKVTITDKQKKMKMPTGIRMLLRRCCVAVLKTESRVESLLETNDDTSFKLLPSRETSKSYPPEIR